MTRILLDNDLISLPCEKVSIKEGEKIAQILAESLPDNGIGIAANQIGIQKRVCLVSVKDPVVFINPRIVASGGFVVFPEGCLSFPGKQVLTKRYTTITVVADNHQHPLVYTDKDLLECVCVQHEIDHLNGITMFDREYKPEV